MSIVLVWRRRGGGELALLRGNGPDRSRVNDVAKTLDEILCKAEIEVDRTVVGIVCVEASVLCRVHDGGGGVV